MLHLVLSALMMVQHNTVLMWHFLLSLRCVFTVCVCARTEVGCCYLLVPHVLVTQVYECVSACGRVSV